MSFLTTFRRKFGKTIVIFEISTFEFIKCKVLCSLKSGPKSPHLGTSRLDFEKIILIFEISTFEFVNIQSFLTNLLIELSLRTF